MGTFFDVYGSIQTFGTIFYSLISLRYSLMIRTNNQKPFDMSITVITIIKREEDNLELQTRDRKKSVTKE